MELLLYQRDEQNHLRPLQMHRLLLPRQGSRGRMAVLHILRKISIGLSKHLMPHGDSNSYQDEDSDA